MKKNALHVALLAGLAATAVMGAPRSSRDRPSIEPCMTLRPAAAQADTYELMVYGDIGDSWWGESVTAQSVAEQLNALDDAVATINVRINSYGGSVADGMAIYNALKRHPATKNVTVDGVAMSAASLIAMAGDTVTMPPASLLMIHAPWGGIMGNAKELRKYADILDKFSESMAAAYVAKSGKTTEAVLALLQDGEDHYYTGDEAVAEGFADAVGEPQEDPAEPDESARQFASQLLDRISARGAPARYAGLAVAAAMRKAPLPSATPAAPRITAHAPAPPAASAGNTPPAPAGKDPGASVMTEEEKKAQAKAVLAADKARREAIRAQFSPFLARQDLDTAALQSLQTACEDDQDTTPEAAGAKLLELLGKDTTSVAGNHRTEITRDETATYREGAILATLNRKDPQAFKHDERSQQFRGFNLMDLARDCVERAGIRTRGMSRGEVAIKALQSTSDFPNILEAVITKTLRRGYEGTSRTFVPWTRQATLPDFKEVSRVQLSGAPNLKRVLEGAEYEFGTFSDGAEKYRVQKYGRIVAITWETIINDDLNALTSIPMAFGASAGDLESDIVYGVLTANAALSDNVALFHATHGNLGTPAALIDAVHPDPSVESPLAEARKMMLLQKGLEGRYITVRPRFLMVPPDLYEAALKVTGAGFAAARAQDKNVIGPSLTPIEEPRLHDDSETAFYLAADPTSVDTIEYAYLEGHEGVFTESKAGFEVDGLQVKCRHVFGAKAIDHRGLFKNAGAAPTAWPQP
jgi:ATP-dependent protease ClpP protease subunit